MNLVLLKCEADDLFSFMVRLSGCMCGGRQCLCVGNIMFLEAGEVRRKKQYNS